MNNSVNVQSPSFGMAYKVGNLKKYVEFLNSQEPEVINKLNAEMKEAAEKLKNTKLAHATLYVNEDGKTLCHSINWQEPVFNERGEVGSCFTGDCLGESIKDAVEATLEKEKAMTAAYEYANRQAELLKELAG